MSTQDAGPRAPSPGPDRYLQWDAAYVLGSLSSAERREYEEHLAGCRACQRAVAEIAGMPGLLAQASPEDAAMLTGSVEQLEESPPPEFGPTLLTRARRRRRRVWVVVGSLAAVLALVFGGFGVLFSRGVIGTPTTYRVAFSPVVPSGITAVADVTPGRTETFVQVECQYAATSVGNDSGPYGEYAVWVRDRSGSAQPVKAWYAKPNKVMRPSGTATTGTWRLDSLEIRDAHTGQVLLAAPIR